MLIRATLFLLLGTLSSALVADDDFDRLVRINKAPVVMLVEQRVSGSRRSSHYLDFEARLVEVAGAEAA